MMLQLHFEMAVPIHYDDYNVFLSPSKEYKDEIEGAVLNGRVIHLDRGNAYHISVRGDAKNDKYND